MVPPIPPVVKGFCGMIMDDRPSIATRWMRPACNTWKKDMGSGAGCNPQATSLARFSAGTEKGPAKKSEE